jgi:hypothetical protein
MAENEQDEKVPEPDPRPVQRALGDTIRTAAAEGKIGRPDFGALMEAAGGELAAGSREAGATRQAWDAYRQAEEAYWDTVASRYLTLIRWRSFAWPRPHC